MLGIMQGYDTEGFYSSIFPIMENRYHGLGLLHTSYTLDSQSTNHSPYDRLILRVGSTQDISA